MNTWKQLSLNAALVAGILTLLSCSSTPARVDTGKIRARTFSFVDRGAKPAPAYAENRQVVHGLIQDAITKHLATKGVTPVKSGGDLTVGYLVLVGSNASTTSINDYFGYGEAAMDLHEKAHEAYTGSKNPNYFEAGTLVIDLVDGKTFKLLRRNYATRPVLRDLSTDARAIRIQETVDEILNTLRIEN